MQNFASSALLPDNSSSNCTRYKIDFLGSTKKQLLHLVTPWLSPICTLTEHCTDKSAFGRRDCLPAINAMETMPQHGSILPEDSPVKI